MMNSGDFNDDVWDEYEWENHLNEIEKNNSHLRDFFTANAPDDPPRWLSLLDENYDEHDAVDAFIEEELQSDDVYFPEWDWDGKDWEDFEDEQDDFFPDDFDEEDDFDIGEEWKELSDEYAASEYGSIEMLDIYNNSRELAAVILHWAETINPKYLTPQNNSFIGNILKIGAKIAGGYSFGFEPDFLGGNIAYTKKALYCANDALSVQQEYLKDARFITQNQYQYFHERLFSLRNDIGIYIQELREQFYNRF